MVAMKVVAAAAVLMFIRRQCGMMACVNIILSARSARSSSVLLILNASLTVSMDRTCGAGV